MAAFHKQEETLAREMLPKPELYRGSLFQIMVEAEPRRQAVKSFIVQNIFFKKVFSLSFKR